MPLSNSLLRVAAAVLAFSVTAAVFTVPASGSGASARGPITLDAHDQPVREVLLRVGELARLNVSIGEDVRGKVNLILREATADDAFRAICSQLRLRCTREGRTMSVRGSSAAIVPLAIVSAQRAASVLRTLYPRLTVRTDPSANALAIEGSDAELQAARAVIQGLDVRDASKPTSEAITLHGQNASVVADKLHGLFPAAKVTVVSRSALIVSAVPPDLTQIKALVAALDAPTPAPTLMPVANDAVKVTQRRPDEIARAVARQMPRVRTAVAGSAVAVSGSPDDVARAKILIGQLDLPAFDARYVQLYRLRNVDAQSVADLVRRAFPSLAISVDAGLNALTVTATAAEHQRIADGIAQLDGTANGSNGAQGAAGGGYGGPSGHEIVTLRSILPGGQGQSGVSATPQDIAQTVQQALQSTNADLHVLVSTGTQQLVITGSPQSIRAAKQMIAELDVVPPSVVLDTEILELDQSSSRNLGLQLGTTSIGTTFSEVQPTPDPNGGSGRLMRLQALTRTGISFQAQLNLLVQNGKARVLADPRITTVSGRTATIRAGDTISILTTVGGGTGTVATTQLQSFQTGVTLDITPIITGDGELSVSLHPVVNSLSGFLNNVPQIATRDTQTTVHLRDEETLVIGGLIQESTQQTESKVPLVGDIPLIGRIFRNQQTTNTRNELIIVVTPHLLLKGTTTTVPSAANPAGMIIPTPRPLPTVPSGTAFPPPGYSTQLSVRRTPMPVQRATSAPGAPVAAALRATESPSASPTPIASAFAQANVFVYGSPPTSTFAGPADAPEIFYAMLSPTILTSNATVRVNAITTTNVQRLTIGTGATTISLSQASPSGTWQGVFPANAFMSPAASSVQLTLTASRSDGQAASVQIPVSISR